MSNIVDRVLNGIRDRVLSPEELQYRQQKIQAFEMVKLASLASACTSILFAVIFPSIFTFIGIGITAFFASEVFTAASNILEIIRNVRAAGIAYASRDALISDIAKKTFIMESVIAILNPSFESLIELTL